MNEVSWRTKAYLVGGVLGMAVGLGAAYLYITAVDQEGGEPDFHPSAAVGIGLTLLGLMRQIAALPEAEKEKG